MKYTAGNPGYFDAAYRYIVYILQEFQYGYNIVETTKS